MISHSKKFIFVPIRKGAGNSILKALRKFTEPDDRQKLNRGVLSQGFSNGVNYGNWQVPRGYRVVTVCRNPFTKVASAFRTYRSNKRPLWLPHEPTFRQFLDSLPTMEEDETVWFHTQCSVSQLLTDSSGKFTAGTVLRFEHIQEDFDAFCQKLELGSITLSKRNSSGVSPVDQFALYDDYSRQWVSTMYSDDIERFGYEFPESPDV